MLLLNDRKDIELDKAVAITDAAFRERCLKDGKQVLEEIAGEKISESVTIQFVENSEDKLTFVLPPMEKHGELSDDELDGVAGGFVRPIITRPSTSHNAPFSSIDL